MSKPKETITREQVEGYLREHPDFFEMHGDLFEIMKPPPVEHGGNVVDLRYHMVGKLQTGIQSLKSKYEGLITSSRDNMSTLHQVHEGVLSLIRAPGLEQLLERIIIDLPALFGVDIVRLGLESEIGEAYHNKFGEQNASGVAIIEEGFIDRVMGREKSILLAADMQKQFIYGFDQIFADCSGIIESCALLRMRLPSNQRGVLLAFGVRIKGHFYEGQGTEMLSFLAQIIEHRLDECLRESGIAQLI